MAKKTDLSKRDLEVENLRTRLAEAEDTLRAIRQGEVDALVVATPDGPQTFTLRGADQIYRLLVETMNEGALTVDQRGTIFYANQRLATLLDLPLENLFGSPVAALVGPEDMPALQTLWQSMQRGQPTYLETTLVGRERRVPVLLSMAPLTQAAVPGMSLLVTDLTRQKAIEAELRQTQAGLQEQARAQTQDLSQALASLQKENLQRQAAEADLAAQVENLRAAQDELRARALELRAQNDELQAARAALEAAHAELVEENYRLEAVMETLPVGIAILDSQGGNLNSNALFEEVWGSPRPPVREVADYAAYRAWWVDTGRPVQPAEWASARAVGHGETVIAQTMRIQRFDGTLAYILNSAAPILDAYGQIVGCAVAVQDITRQMEADEALRRSTERFRLLSEVGAKLLAAEDPQAIVEELCAGVMAHLDCQVFFNYLADPTKGNLRLNAYGGLSAAQAAQIERLDYGTAVCGRVAETGERMVVEDLQHSSDPRTDLVRPYGLQAYACHPLTAGGRVIGTLSFGTTTRLRFTDEELELMRTVADQVAIGMDRMQSATALRQALARAEDGQRLLEALMEYVPDGISIADGPEGAVRMVSRYGQELLGLAHNRLTVAQIAEVLPVFREDGFTPLPAEETPLMRAIRHGEVVRDQEIVQANAMGQRVALLCNAAPLRDAAGAVVGGVVAWRDIGARKKTENALRLSEQRFRLALKNAPVTVATQDRSLRFTWAYNQRSVPPEAVIGKTDTDLFPPETAAQLLTLKHRVLETGSDVRDSLWVSSGGRRFFLNIYLEPILDEAGEIAGVGVATVDLTEQKQAEAALQAARAELEQRVQDRTLDLQRANAQLQAEVLERRQAERQIQLQTSALQAAANGIVITDRQGKILWCNPAFTTLTGYPAAEALGQTLRLVRSEQHPPDFFRTMWETILAGQVWQGEMVNRRKDGTLYTEQQTITPVRDEAGQISHFIAIKRDVTQRRRLEQELLNANALLERVFASIDLLVAYLDRDFNYLRVNRAYAAATQQTPEDFAGRNLFTLHPDLESAEIFRQVVATGESYAAYEEPLSMIVADGPAASYWDWSLQPVKDATENVQGLVLSLVDVTQRKQAQDQLRRNAQRSQALAEVSQTLAEATFDSASVLQAVARRTAELFGDICVVSLVEEGETLINTEILQHPDPALARQLQARLPAASISLDQARIARHIATTGQPLLIPEITAELGRQWFGADYWPVVQQLGVHSLLGVPLKAQGRALGQILLFRLQRAAAYTTEDLQTAQSLAERAALALANARLYQNLQAALEQEKSVRAQLVQAEKLAAVGRVVGSVAHEINNPLQTINNCLFLTAGDLPSDSPVHEYLQMAFSETERLTNLVAQLRQVYRPYPTGTPERLNLLRLLDKVQALLSANLEKHHVEWRLASSLADAPARGVEDQLTQVFINLGQNAIEAMQPDGGVLAVTVAPSEDARHITVSFQDTGPGLAEADLDRLFEPFYTTKPAGLGLGLSICSDIIKRHDGRIAADNCPQGGAVFTVWLPSTAPSDARDPSPSPSGAPAGQG